MATQNDFYRSFVPSAAMSANRRVAVASDGTISYAGATALGVGILQDDVQGLSYETASVRLFGTGTVRVAVSAASTTGDSLILAANGKVVAKGATTTGVTFGTALSTASADAQVLEAVPLFYSV